MKRVIPPLLLVPFILLAFSAIDISTLKTQILNRLKDYTTEKFSEKIYVHTDKPFYTAGENIWFSAYLVNGVTHTKNSKSSVIYVELINEKGDIISERKLFSEKLSAEGDFKLPLELKDGTYTLRAYTNYMRNQPRDYFFIKEIPVYSLYANEEEETSKPTESEELPNIGFYPEGGYLISGIRNKVAVKIKDADVDAFPIFGIIEDLDGNRITDFQTFEFGLGYFYLKPELGKEYRAVISSKDENIHYLLPLSLSEGYVMNTSISDKELTVEISTNRKDGLKNTLIIGHQRGLPVFDYIEKENKKSVLFKIPKTDLIEGVLDLVLFNESKNAVAERMVYVKKENEVNISVKKTNGNTTRTRDRVDLKIDVKDFSAKVVRSTLSISITDAKMITPNKNAENIRTYLLLNSDLRGDIKSPNYFFTKGNETKKNAQLDLIMMTHGWRRFEWLELLEVRSQQKFEPEDGIYIRGNTISPKSPYQFKMSETQMAIRQQGFYQETQPTDKYGRFSYGPYVFNDTVDILFQAGENLSSEKPNFMNTNIVLDSPIEKPRFLPSWTINPFKQEVSKKNEAYREKARNSVFRNFEYDEERELLDEVTLQGKVETKQEVAEKKRDKRTRSFTPSHRIVVDDMGTHGGGDFLELLGAIPGLRIERKDDDDESPTPNQYAILLRGLEPSYFLDDVKVDMNIARSVHQSNIDFIDVLNTGPASAAYAFEHGGVIAIYTKQGSRGKAQSIKQPGSITFKSPGFYSARSFYAPDYSKIDRGISKKDDRSTLYWNPNLTVEPFKNTNFTFYTSDEKGVFQVEVQGVTDSGIPVYSKALFEVE
jgi:hypothetical protein